MIGNATAEPLLTSTSPLELNRELAELRRQLGDLRRRLDLAIFQLVQDSTVYVAIADVSDDGSEETRLGNVQFGALDEFG